MRVRRRTEVTFETAQVTVIRRAGKAVEVRCPQCGEQVLMLGLEEAMMLSRASSREIHRLVEAGRVHFIETAEGFVLICPETLVLSACLQ